MQNDKNAMQSFLKEVEGRFLKSQGLMPNPLLNYPPLKDCPCLSGIVFLNCCLNKLRPFVTKGDAELYAREMEKPILIFLKSDNQEKVDAFIAEFLKNEDHRAQAD